MTAQSLADERHHKRRKLIQYPDLLATLLDRLENGWSPEQIAGRLKIERTAPQRFCHETIYQYVYSEDGQSDELARYLPKHRKKRKPRYARKGRGRIFPLETSIHSRPEEINDRSQFGNWASR